MNGPGGRQNILIALPRKPFRNYVLEGVARDSLGNTIPNAEITAFEAETDARVAITTADGSAAFSINLGGDSSLAARSRATARWWLRGYLEGGGTAIFGTTLRTLQAEERAAQ